MKINWLICFLITITLVFSLTATASMLIPANDNAKEHSPVIDENGGLERVDFIHYAKPASPAKVPATNCYKLLGVKWNNLPVSYIINPTNTQGLSSDFVTNAISTSAETWDAKTSKELFKDAYEIGPVQYGVLDSKNAIAFGNYPQEGVIAVTSIWFTRVGKQIVEFDILLDTDFTWGDATPAVMDLQNIATHELGHGVGLDDIYSTTCSAVTMYGYSSYGEISKRTLEQPDIAGLQKIYGA